MPDRWSALARYYDWEHDAFDEDVVMYLGFAKRTGGPILELACGTGRLLRPLLEEGEHVVGVDSSAEMLEIARRSLMQGEAAGRVELHQADMRSFSLDRRFPLAFVGLDSFGLLLRRSDQLAALDQVRRHLTPGGLLVVDVANGNLRGGEARDELMIQHVGTDPASGRPLTKWTARQTDLAAQIDHFTYVYDEVQEDRTVKRWTSELELRYFGRFELELLLDGAGFAIEALYGSYDLAPFDSSSDRLIAAAVNPAS